MRIAIIDLGTVSVRFEIYQTNPAFEDCGPSSNKPQRIYRQRQMLRLGDGLYQRKLLNEKAKQSTLDAFSSFKNIIEEYACEQVCAAATSALREADDAEVFIEELSQLFGHRIEIIEAASEAALIARGILANEQAFDTDVVFLDIGGGSTEISLCQSNRIIYSISLPLGAIRCHQIFLKTSPPVPDTLEQGLEALRRHTRLSLEALPASLKNISVKTIIGLSGTIRTLCRIICKGESPADILTRQALFGFVDQLTPLDLPQIIQMPRMEENRADIILAGAVLLQELVDLFAAQEVRPSLFSLRHGLLQREIERALK